MSAAAGDKRQRTHELTREDSADVDWLDPSTAPSSGPGDLLDTLSADGFGFGSGDETGSAAATTAAPVGVDGIPDGGLAGMNAGIAAPAAAPTPGQLLEAQSARVAGSAHGPIVSMGRPPAAATTQELDVWVHSLPQSYALTTTTAERELHVRMMKHLLGEGCSPPVMTSWVPMSKGGQPIMRLHIVFKDHPGSLGALSVILSESGGNIVEVAAHNTTDGYAVDIFSIAHLERINDEMLLPSLDAKIKKALGGPSTIGHTVNPNGAYTSSASGGSSPALTPAGLPPSLSAPPFTALMPASAPAAAGDLSGGDPGGTTLQPGLQPVGSNASMTTPTAYGAPPPARLLPLAPGTCLDPSAKLRPASGTGVASASTAGGGSNETNPSALGAPAKRQNSAGSIAGLGALAPKTAPPPAAAAAAKLAGEGDAAGGALSPLASLPPLTDLSLVEEVGEGSGSKVWRGSWGSMRVAVKVLKVNPTTRKGALRGFVQEATILSQLRHPAICTLLGTCVQHGLPALVLEYMSGGSLFDLLHNSQATVTPPLLSRLALEVASGVNYLHENSVIHRDIKSANVLLDDRMHAKVSDFGISTTFGPEHTAETGTYRCMAPEVITHQRYDHHCDVFSYGVLLWEMSHRQIPFQKDSGLQAAFAVAVERRRPAIKLPPLLVAFGAVITRAWAHEPTSRPNMQSIVVEIMVIDAKVKADCGAALRSHPLPQGPPPGHVGDMPQLPMNPQPPMPLPLSSQAMSAAMQMPPQALPPLMPLPSQPGSVTLSSAPLQPATQLPPPGQPLLPGLPTTAAQLQQAGLQHALGAHLQHPSLVPGGEMQMPNPMNPMGQLNAASAPNGGSAPGAGGQPMPPVNLR